MKYTTDLRRTAGFEVYVGRKELMTDMPPDVPSIIEQIEFRVLIEFEEEYQAYVARCIETGAVASGDTIEEAENSIKAVLENDFRIAITQGSLESLFHSPAAWDINVRWYEMKAHDPEGMRRVAIEVGSSDSPQKRGMHSELRIFTDSKTRTA